MLVHISNHLSTILVLNQSSSSGAADITGLGVKQEPADDNAGGTRGRRKKHTRKDAEGAHAQPLTSSYLLRRPHTCLNSNYDLEFRFLLSMLAVLCLVANAF